MEAWTSASEDKKKQESIEVKNTADALIYTCEKTLKDAGDKVKPEDKKGIEEKISALKEAQKGDNMEDIKNKTKDLSEAIQKVGAELYKQQPQQNPSAGGEEKPKDEPKAEEGKFTEEK